MTPKKSSAMTPTKAQAKSQRESTVQGNFQHLIYSPRGDIEGALLQADDAPLQLVFEHHDAEAVAQFEALTAGQQVSVCAHLQDSQGRSPKGEPAHPVYTHVRLLKVDGLRPAKIKAAVGPAYQGRVVRLNFARHGEANGVVLDSGDFIHTKPDGMARLRLKVGDSVQADGDAQRLADDSGWAVEARHVNGKPVKPH